MADKLTLDVGLAVDLKAGFARNGWTEAQIKRLSQGTFLKDVLDVLEGRAEIKPREGAAVIDLDADPFVPKDWTAVDHRRGGTVDLATVKLGLYLHEDQKHGRMLGHVLRANLGDEHMLNANVLDFLLKNPQLIPEDWKGKCVCFWGTVYCGIGGRLSVRYLRFFAGGWNWHDGWLGSDWDAGHPSAILER